MLSISKKISLVFSVSVIALGGILLFLTSEVMHKHFAEQNIRWGHTLARVLSESISEHIINKDEVKAKQILSRLIQENKRLVFIYIIDFDGNIATHTFSKGVPKALFEQHDPEIKFHRFNLDKTQTLEIWNPLIEGLPARIHIGLDSTADDQYVHRTLWTLAGLFIIFALVIAVLGAIYGRRIGKPLELLASQLTRYGSGTPATELTADTKFHEINQLIESFNRMMGERKEFLDEILSSRNGLNKAQEIAHIGNWVWDIESGGLEWSDEVYRIFGYEPQTFKASYERFLAAIHEADREKVQEAVNASVSDPDVKYAVEHRIVRPNDDIRWVLEKGEILFSDNRPVQMTGIVYDITETKKAELVVRAYQEELEIKVKERTMELAFANRQLQQLDQLKSMFIATMSHELRTPLNSIIGFTSVILKGMTGDLNDKQRDQLSRVLTSAQHLLHLISDIIDISKIEAGRIDVTPEKIRFSALLEELDGQIRSLFSNKDIQFTKEVIGNPEFISDRVRLTQVLINLLSNAAKYTEAGQVSLTARQNNNSVEITVKDTGVGISREDLKRLFTPFDRIDNKLSVKSGGTGLGLYLTKKLLDDVLAGQIKVESKPGKGSCFTVVLPHNLNTDDVPVIERQQKISL